MLNIPSEIHVAAIPDTPGVFCGGKTVPILELIIIIAVASFLSLLANVCISHAFTLSKNDAAVAAIDLTIIVFAVVVDLLRSILCADWLFFPDIIGLKGLGIICIFGAALVITWLYEDEVKTMAKKQTRPQKHR